MNEMTTIIKKATSMHSTQELSRLTGIPYQTLRYRFKHPQTWKAYELGQVLNYGEFEDSDYIGIMGEIKDWKKYSQSF